MPRVFIVEPTRAGISLDSAKSFGEIVTVFSPDVRRPSAFSINEYIPAVLSRLRDLEFNPMDDCLCIAGALVPNALFIAAALAVYDPVNMLFFDAARGVYIKKTEVSVHSDRIKV